MKKLICIAAAYGIGLAVFGQATNSVAVADFGGDLVEDAIKLLNSLYGLPAHLVVAISCICVGWALRLVKQFPNDGIPLVCVLWGMVVNPLMAEKVAGMAVRPWLTRNIVMGLIIGLGSWMLHKAIIRRFEHAIPVLGPMLQEADANADVAPAAQPVLVAKPVPVPLNDPAKPV